MPEKMRRIRIPLGLLIILVVVVLALMYPRLRRASLIHDLELDPNATYSSRRADAAKELLALGHDAVPALIACLASRKPNVRPQAAELLETLAQRHEIRKEDLPALVSRLGGPAPLDGMHWNESWTQLRLVDVLRLQGALGQAPVPLQVRYELLWIDEGSSASKTDADVRAKWLLSLGPAALSEMIEVLSAPRERGVDDDLRWKIAVRIDAPWMTDVAQGVAGDADPRTRKWCALQIGWRRERESPSDPAWVWTALERLAADPDAEVSVEAGRAIQVRDDRRGGNRMDSAIQALLSSPHAQSRRTAVEILERPPVTAGRVARMSELAHDPDQEVRTSAVLALGNLGVCASVPSLEAMLRHPDAHVRWGATRAIGSLPARYCAEALASMLDDAAPAGTFMRWDGKTNVTVTLRICDSAAECLQRAAQRAYLQDTAPPSFLRSTAVGAELVALARQWWAEQGRSACESLARGRLTIDKDTTWSGARPLVGEVLISPGATLSLEPGTKVTASAGSRLVVEGGLLAVGTKAAPILFQAEGGARWQGIEFRPCSDPARCTLTWCRLMSAEVAVACIGASPHVFLCRFVGDGIGVDSNDDLEHPNQRHAPVIERNLFLNDRSAIEAINYAEATVRYNLFLGCEQGFDVLGSSPESKSSFCSNIVARCGTAIEIRCVEVELGRNVIVGNMRGVLVAQTAGDVHEKPLEGCVRNLIQGNTEGDSLTEWFAPGAPAQVQPRAFDTLGTDNLCEAVQFVRADYEHPESGDWHLAPHSPGKGEGPEGEDIGVYPRGHEADPDWLPLGE